MKKLENQLIIKCSAILAEAFNPENENNLLNELEEDPTLTIHYLFNMSSANIYNKLTANEVNALEFNHILNQLCFQFLDKPTK